MAMEQAAVYLTTPLALEAPPAAAADALPAHFAGTAYSGAVLSDWGVPFVIDLDSTRIEAAPPLLHEHRREAVIGTIHSAENTGAALAVAGEPDRVRA